MNNQQPKPEALLRCKKKEHYNKRKRISKSKSNRLKGNGKYSEKKPNQLTSGLMNTEPCRVNNLCQLLQTPRPKTRLVDCLGKIKVLQVFRASTTPKHVFTALYLAMSLLMSLPRPSNNKCKPKRKRRNTLYSKRSKKLSKQQKHKKVKSQLRSGVSRP